MRNVKSGVRIVNAKQKCPLFAVRAFLFFEKKNLLPKLWGCGREARECGQPVGNARRNARSMATRPSALSTGCPHAPKGVFFGTPIIGRFLGHPSLSGHRHPPLLGHPPPQQGHRNKDTHPAPCPNRGFVLIATLWTLAAMAVLAVGLSSRSAWGDGCPCGLSTMAVLAAGCPCGRLSLRPTSTASCPPTSSAPLSRRPRSNGSSRGAARGHAGPPVRRLCGHGARHATLGRSQRCGSARVLESRDGQDHSHGRYPLALPG